MKTASRLISWNGKNGKAELTIKMKKGIKIKNETIDADGDHFEVNKKELVNIEEITLVAGEHKFENLYISPDFILKKKGLKFALRNNDNVTIGIDDDDVIGKIKQAIKDVDHEVSEDDDYKIYMDNIKKRIDKDKKYQEHVNKIESAITK